MESLPMEDLSPPARPAQPRAPPAQQQWPQPIMAATMAGTTGMAAQAAAPAPSPEIDWGAPMAGAPPARTPVKHIRCPVCKTRIPIFDDVEQEIKCPVCGKRGPYRPKGGTPGTVNREPSAGTTAAGGPMFVHAPEPSSEAALDALVWRPRRPTPAPTITPVSRSRPQPQFQPQPQEQPARRTRCSNCGSPVPIYGNTFPVRVTCPNCGRSGTYNGPKR
jgi:ribosomal protein S27E